MESCDLAASRVKATECTTCPGIEVVSGAIPATGSKLSPVKVSPAPRSSPAAATVDEPSRKDPKDSVAETVPVGEYFAAAVPAEFQKAVAHFPRSPKIMATVDFNVSKSAALRTLVCPFCVLLIIDVNTRANVPKRALLTNTVTREKPRRRMSFMELEDSGILLYR